MRSPLRLRAFALAWLCAGMPLLLAVNCPTDLSLVLQLEVHGVGSGSGSVTTPSARVACTVAAGINQGDCTEAYTNEGGQVVLTAVPADGSVFVEWVNNTVEYDDEPVQICSDPASAICAITLGPDAPPSVTLQPHFALEGVEDRRFQVLVGVPGVLNYPSALIEITTPEGDIRCGWSSAEAKYLGPCFVMRPLGSTVTLDLTYSGVPADYFIRWHGCTPATAPRCSVTNDAPGETRVIANFGTMRSNTASVLPEGAGAGRVTSQPGGLDCSWTGSGSAGTCTATFPETTMVTLTAVPEPGSVFQGWTGNPNGLCVGTTGPCLLDMAFTRGVGAAFAPAPAFALTVAGGGMGVGIVTSAPVGIMCTVTAAEATGTCAADFAGGAPITLTASPASGSTFTGWSGGGCSGTGTCVVSLSVATTVTAAFDVAPPTTFPLTVTGAGPGSGTIASTPAGIACTITAGSASGTCSANFVAGQVVALFATASGASAFTGWSGSGCTGGGSCDVPMTGAASVSATFAVAHTLTVSLTGAGTGSVASTPSGIACNPAVNPGIGCAASFPANTIVTLTATPLNVSVFAGWSGGGCSGTGPCVVTLAAATSVTAMFVLNTLTVVVAGPGDGSVASSPAGISCNPAVNPGAGCAASFANNTLVTLTATPANVSAFSGWSGGGCSGTGPCVVTMTAATTVTATFVPNTLSVVVAGGGTGSVTSSPPGIVCNPGVNPGSGCAASFPNSTVVTLTAAPTNGSSFAGWSGAGCSGTGACVVTMTGAATVTATFDPAAAFTLDVSFAGNGQGTVTSVPPGINCANFSSGGGSSSCSASYGGGTAVTLTAAPNSGSSFTGWSGVGGCAGTGPCIVTMSTSRAVVATFTLATFPLTVSGAGTGSGTVTESSSGIACGITAGTASGTCTRNISSGLVVFPIATPAPGSVFAGWSGDCSGTGLCAVAMDQARNVTATFTAVPTFTLTIRQGSAITGNGVVTSNPTGISCVFTNGQTTPTGTCVVAFPVGTVVTLTAGVAPPSTFTTWTGVAGCSFGNPVCVVTMDQDRTVDVVISP